MNKLFREGYHRKNYLSILNFYLIFNTFNKVFNRKS